MPLGFCLTALAFFHRLSALGQPLIYALMLRPQDIGMQSTQHGILVWVGDSVGRHRRDTTIEMDPKTGTWPSVTVRAMGARDGPAAVSREIGHGWISGDIGSGYCDRATASVL